MNQAEKYIVTKDKHAFRRIPVGEIVKNPNQPRKIFDMDSLIELEKSVRMYGVISPLTVRKKEGCYELIAGERRLRAAKLAGLATVPCYILNASEEESGLMALVENLQRKDLDFFEEALALQRLTHIYGMTQQQAADRIGKSQSAIANKMRLLRLLPQVMDIIRLNGLTERHARCLLRIEDYELQIKTVKEIAANQMNVEVAEGYVDSVLSPPKVEKPAPKRQILVKDVRIFLNTIDRALDAMHSAGIPATVDKKQDGDDFYITLHIPSAIKEGNVSRETVVI